MRLTKRNYYSSKANEEYMSASQFKAFLKCEAGALAELRGDYTRESSTALLIGSYVDAHFSGEEAQFRGMHPEIFKKDGTLKSDYIRADEIIRRIEEQPVMMDLLHGKTQKIFTGKINGVPFKCKTDSYKKDVIADLKVMKDFAPVYLPGEGRVPWFEAWGYDIQGAIYRELVRQKTGNLLPFVLVAATKEPETDLAAIEISPELLDYQLKQVTALAPRYDAIKKGQIAPTRCEKCAYCKRTKRVQIIKSEDLEDD